jgi:protein involved in polysaccharide export with SLBB domain
MKKILLFILFIPVLINAQINMNDKFSTENLMKEGFISVTIGGDFIVTGSFPALMSERVDQFVTRIYNDAREQAINPALPPEQVTEVMEKIDSYIFRGLRLKHSSGEEEIIDLIKFRMNGDFKNNPFLKNDDVIIFPSSNIETNFFTISGAVNSPGKFYFVEGDRLSDAVELAAGLNEAYKNISKVEIHRMDPSGKEYDVTTVELSGNDLIKRGDRIIVKTEPMELQAFTVTVLGEVNAPGEIPITKDRTTIKEVLEIAGGLKETAALNRSRLYSDKALNFLLEKRYGYHFDSDTWNRELNEFVLNFEHSMFYRMSNVTEEDSLYFIIENEIRTLTQGTSIDFRGLNDPASEVSNYTVTDGDIIVIPPKLNKVYIFGQVNDPGYVTLENNKDYLYYINKAGGLGEYADPDRTMIIKGKSFAWHVPDTSVVIEDGDYIFVSRDPVRSFSFYLNRTATFLAIAGSIATIVLLLMQLTE